MYDDYEYWNYMCCSPMTDGEEIRDFLNSSDEDEGEGEDETEK